MENLITTKELCEKLKVTRQTVFTWRSQGMPYKKYGKIVRFNYEEVEKWLKER